MFDGSRLQDSCVDIFGDAAMNMKNSVMRVNTFAAVLAVATKKLEAARLFARQVHQTYGKVLHKLVTLPHENPERMLSIQRLQRHVVPLHLSIHAHLPLRRFIHLLRTRNEVDQFLVRECSHGL